jgi:hypothetical protein
VKPLLTPSRAEAGVWIILYAGLIAGIGIESDWGRQTEWAIALPGIEPAAFVKTTLTEPYQLPAPDALLETTLRPLFVANRRPAPIPPPPEPPKPPKPQMRKGQFSLTGTTIVAEGKFAHLVEKATNKAIVLAEGKEINGIKVQQVTPDFVVLTQFDDSETLVLSTAKAPLLQPGTRR